MVMYVVENIMQAKGIKKCTKTVFSRILELGVNAKLNFMPSLEG